VNRIARHASKSVAAAILAVSLAACGGGSDRFTIAVDGSSTVGPISKAVANEFNSGSPRGVSVTVAESGTGGGFSKFCQGTIQIADASRPITQSEMDICAQNGISFIELPIAFDALTVVVHPNNPVSELSVDQLKKIWEPAAEGKVMNWKDVDPSFPDQPISLFGPGTASGTFDYFTAAIVGSEGSSRKDYSPSENDNNIVLGVSGDEGALGYFGLAYLDANKDTIKAMPIKATADGAAVSPDPASVVSGAYVPLSRPIFIYVNADALKAKPVNDFVSFYLQNVDRIAPQVGYVALPPEAYAVVRERVSERKTGTVFGGESGVGLSIDEVLALETGGE
jgi:phosphate transport system substrate-binding protein